MSDFGQRGAHISALSSNFGIWLFECTHGGRLGNSLLNFDPSNEIRGFVSDRHKISMTGSSDASITASCGAQLIRGSCPADPFLQICLKVISHYLGNVLLLGLLLLCQHHSSLHWLSCGCWWVHRDKSVSSIPFCAVVHCLVNISLGMASHNCYSISRELVEVGELPQRTAWTSLASRVRC